jgi:broad specificity phosphatase PhoE
MSLAQKWPDVLWIARHGQSAANVARDEAEAAGNLVVSVASRDVDIQLSDLGARQAAALGRWFASMNPSDRPNVVLSSPYLRAKTTAQLVLESAGMTDADVDSVVDERLREREFGILDGLTSTGVQQRYPDQFELKQSIGKFYHRPPGGESWCDVILRLRSVIDTLTRDYRRMRVLLVTHAVVVMCFRYLLDRLDESEILSIDRINSIANCSVTTYGYDPTLGGAGRMVLRDFNVTTHLTTAGAPVTTVHDVPAAPK